MSGGARRYEYKYLIGARSAELLGRQLPAVISTDRHGDARGKYFVRSVYFDDDAYTAYCEKFAGVDVRNKYRLRFYNMDPGRLVFEAKRKRGPFVTKESAVVSRETAERLLSGARLTGRERETPLIAEFDALCAASNVKPSVIVDYERTAFVHPLDDVRITLDSDVRAEAFCPENVFCRRAAVPVLEHGEVVLEVKFDRALPPFLSRLLSNVPKILCANSKYCNCLAVYL